MAGKKQYIRKKEDKKPVRLFTLDTETRGLDGELFRAGIYDGKDYTPSNNFKSLQQILLEASIENDVHIFVHNLNFDLAKIIKDLSQEIKFLESIIINGRATIIKTSNFTFHDSFSLFPASLDKLCKDFNIKDRKMDLIKALEGTDYIQYEPNVRRTIYKTFRANRKKKIDKKATLKKYFMEVSPDDPLLNEYLEFDCKSLFEIIKRTIDGSGLTIHDFMSCPTTASLSLKVYSTKFKQDFLKATRTEYQGRIIPIETKLRTSYYGGRTEVFIPKLENGFHYDVTSLYPHCMREYKYPVGEYEERTGTKAKIQYQLFKRNGFGGGIIEATVKIPNDMQYPILPYREYNKLLFPTGTITGSWTFHELLFAEERGIEVLEVHSTIFFKKMVDIFSKFVTFFEKLKNDNTFDSNDPDKEINPSLRQYAKLILNSLYGKFATERERTTYTSKREIDETIEKLLKKEEIFLPEIRFFENLRKKGWEEAQKAWTQNEDISLIGRMPYQYSNKVLGEDLIKFSTYITSEYVQVQISSYVTAYARMELYKGMENIINRGGKIYYCDTDSIVSDIELEPDFISDTIFGKWKLEGEIKKAYFSQPKVYIEEDQEGNITKKFKGLPKTRVEYLTMSDYAYINMRQEKQDTEKIQLIDKKDGYENIIKPITAIKKNQSFNKVIQIEKSLRIRGIMEKRKMDYVNNTSKPWSFDQGSINELKQYFEELKKENEKFIEKRYDPIYSFVQKEGYIEIPKKNTPLYAIYKTIQAKIKRKYFRTKGIHIDYVAEHVNYHPEDLLLELSLEM